MAASPEENRTVDDAYDAITTAVRDELESLLRVAPERAGRDLLTWLRRDAEGALYPVVDGLYRAGYDAGYDDGADDWAES